MKTYHLADYRQYEIKPGMSEGAQEVLYHDISLHQWRLTIQLDEHRIWFLSVFFDEEGAVKKFSLDYEAENDSHYVFHDESGVRRALAPDKEENTLLDEIFRDYIIDHGGFTLVDKLEPYITEQYHF